jgi:hypothetical protein
MVTAKYNHVAWLGVFSVLEVLARLSNRDEIVLALENVLKEGSSRAYMEISSALS